MIKINNRRQIKQKQNYNAVHLYTKKIAALMVASSIHELPFDPIEVIGCSVYRFYGHSVIIETFDT